MRTLELRQVRILCHVTHLASLSATIAEAKQLAVARDGIVEFTFNGVLLRVHPLSDVDKVAAYWSACEAAQGKPRAFCYSLQTRRTARAMAAKLFRPGQRLKSALALLGMVAGLATCFAGNRWVGWIAAACLAVFWASVWRRFWRLTL